MNGNIVTPSQALISWDTAPITTPGKTSTRQDSPGRFIDVARRDLVTEMLMPMSIHKENHGDKIEDSKIQSSSVC